eukprot:CAMPEP_0201910704 /NCGR_PEP_ID=MMETSP0903-20130614/1979_1 /ASSEMBLY_ACC=CAM_ASM_000552 /TAXON_ID=420261 /ORGANISM="Thalassiosira antarctica, Strain CCMP982" /LENGTH=319 /DNA_ID=CAMNT_0048445375 /DNA_START=44 /DNA_END=1003 /DNA_ORIENTATION=+
MTENDTSDANAMEAEVTEQSNIAENADESEAVAEVVAESDDGNDEGAASVEAGNDNVADKEDGEAIVDEASSTSESKSDSKKRSIEEAAKVDDEPLPTLPLKRARTAYFIFADDKREEVKQKHQGEGVATIAKAIGALWSALQPPQKEPYETQAANERSTVSRNMQRLKDAGLWPEATTDALIGGGQDDDAIIFPIGRIRKICKLDPDVKGMSKESTLLITKATELFCTKLGKECVTMAQMQNRRKLMPDDVVEVCSIRERFMFLKPDLIDLRKAQIDEMHQKDNGKDGKGGGGGRKTGGEESGAVNTLESYFGKVRNS